MKKLSFLLAILLLLSVCTMTACKEKKPEATTPQSTTPEETTPEPGATVVHASISLEALANYEIVVAKSSSEEADALTKELQQTMQNVFNLPFTLKTENAYNETQYEILIGETGRKESTEFLSKYNMTWEDYGYAIVGDKLVIRGANEDGTIEALRAFLRYVRGHNKGEVFFTNANLYLVTDTSYPCPYFTINGIAAKQLSILCNEQALGGVAQIIRDAIIEASGIAVPIVTDKEIDNLENAIIVGDTAFVNVDAAPDEIAYPTGREYYVDTSWGCLWLRAKTAAGYYSAATKLTAQFSGKGGNNIVITNSDGKGGDAIAVMSFNLMAGAQKGDKRVDRVIETILKYRPAVVGVQEATDSWMNLLREHLGDTYTVVGVGRNADGHDEHSAILYLTKEFDCLESGTKWLSETPDVAGSQHSTALSEYPRIMTYVHLSRKSDGKQFLHVNTHLDYGTSSEAEAVKVAQMQVLLSQIEKFSGIPTIITGDFNATVDSPVYQMITGAGYQDSCYGNAFQEPTYHGLMGTTGAPSHIDFIFHQNMEYSSYFRICTERVDNENVSDHYPILTVLTFSSIGK